MSKKTKSPFGREAVREEVPGVGVILFGVVDNHEPAKLPWYRDPSKIPAEMLDEAKAVAASMSSSDADLDWLLRNWTLVTTGYNSAVKMHRPWFMMSPTQAIEWMRTLCRHDWARGERWGSWNRYLGTGSEGYWQTCGRCGTREQVVTASSNWSGD
jgi:hypothetical protein